MESNKNRYGINYLSFFVPELTVLRAANYTATRAQNQGSAAARVGTGYNIFKLPKAKTAKGILILVLLFVCCFFSLRAAAQQAGQLASAQADAAYVKNRIIFKFKDGLSPVYAKKDGSVVFNIPGVDELDTKYRCVAAKRINEFKNEPESYTYFIDFKVDIDVPSVIKQYEATQSFEYVEPDYKCSISTTTPNDEYFYPRQSGLYNDGTFPYGIAPKAGADIKMKQAWDVTKGSSSIIVAVIDGGAKLDHPEFAGRIWRNPDYLADSITFPYDSVGWNFVNDNENPTDENGHGTNVAGIIGANGNNNIGYAGMDWNCKLMILKVFGARGTGGSAVMITQAITYAVNHGANVINMSLASTGMSLSMRSAINYAYGLNVTCVAAMGNWDTLLTPPALVYPAAFSHVIAVGATNSKDWRAKPFQILGDDCDFVVRPARTIAGYTYGSNYGPDISVVAPGDIIFGLSYNSNTNYCNAMSGTSQATPHVSGLAALLLAQDPSRSPDLIKAIIDSTADDMVGNPTEDTLGYDQYMGNGRINAWHALCYYTGKIRGRLSVCIGVEDTLCDTTAGGTWSISDTTVAVIDSTRGIVTGVSAGTAMITYQLANGCMANKILTVTPILGGIYGDSILCAASTDTLRDSASGGTWNSGNTAVVTIGSASGVVTGVAAGTVIITYKYISGCMANKTLTVNPVPAKITGDSALCVGSFILLGDATNGGTWSSSDSSVAAVAMVDSGFVTGMSVGTATITYKLVTGCMAGKVLTVNPLPAAITGDSMVCAGLTDSLKDITSGGTWSSGDTSVAGIDSNSGVVTGISAGTVIITYKLVTGCMANKTLTVNPVPAKITGDSALCVGSFILLGDATNSGTWSSSDSSVAAVAMVDSGFVTGMSVGTATITYKLVTGCMASKMLTVNPLPAAITGDSMVCAGLTDSLKDITSGGTWSSGDTSVAGIDSNSGVVTGISAGTVIITYKLVTGCMANKTITVNPVPASIIGDSVLCMGRMITLHETMTGGTWSTNDTAVATVDSGYVTGVSAGTAIITYKLATGCMAHKTVTVNAIPDTVYGYANICTGISYPYRDSTHGGVWTSGNTSAATIDSMTGIAIGVAAGVANITYTISSGCSKIKAITVNASPAAITGPGGLCVGTSATFADVTTFGGWSTTNPSVASLDDTIGTSTNVTGVSAGTATISYTLFSSGCASIRIVTVSTTPSPIAGTDSLCTGVPTTFTDATSYGTWSSSNTSAATVGSLTGVVTGVAVGLANITYAVSAGCSSVKFVIVSSSPAAISGSSSPLCVGASMTFADVSTGGTWSSNNPSVGSVSAATGSSISVTGVSPGTATISYTAFSGCASTKSVSVNVTPSPISGADSICVGASATFTDAPTGGVWSSSNTSAAMVSTTGVVTGEASGVANISYSISGCYAVKGVVSKPSPSPVSGSSSPLCVGASTTFTDATSVGTWSSSNPSVGSVSPATGTSTSVTGVSPGTATIIYTSSLGCTSTKAVSVNVSPLPISGTGNLCTGASTTFTDLTTGGTWSSSNTSAAMVSSSGVVTGEAVSTANISYSLSGCYAVKAVTISASPAAISGSSTALCVGASTTFTDATTGGTWSSSNPTVGSISTTTGTSTVVTGVSPGTASVTYTTSLGCTTIKAVSVNVSPLPISGTSSLCAGASTSFTDGTTGGTWSSSNTSAAMVSSTGVVTGEAVSVANISYSISGCYAVKAVTVSASPAAISGSGAALCVGASTTFTEATTGGTWSSSNPTVGSISTATGTSTVVTGASPGTATISYTAASGCASTKTVSVNATPLPISGTGSICAGSSNTFTDGTSGGVWSSSNTSAATVSSTGIVTGMAVSTANISYGISGCYAVKGVTVSASPASISASSAALCVGSSTTFVDATTGGTWTSSNTIVAIVGSGTGTSISVTGESPGTAIVSYTLSSGCTSSKEVTVNAVPNTISGTGSLCSGDSTSFTDTITFGSGGTWSSSNTSVATVSAPFTDTHRSGCTVAGISAGGAFITYTLATGCFTSIAVTVSTTPAAIAGYSAICNGVSYTFTDATSGGAWSLENIVTDATISPTTGTATTVTGSLGSGTPSVDWVKYTVSSGCFREYEITVYPSPDAISGISTLERLETFTFTDPTPDGAWTSSNTSAAIINASSGLAEGSMSGITNIIYTAPDGCTTFYPLTVTETIFGGRESSGVQNTTGGPRMIVIFPNPNDGEFTIKGSTGDAADDEVSLDIIDIAGHEVYKSKVLATDGGINVHVRLGSEIANGSYILNVHSGKENDEFHFVVEQ